MAYLRHITQRLPLAAWIALVNAVIMTVLILAMAIGNRTDILLWISQNLDVSPALSLFKHPWTLLTYSWVHTDVMHCLFNMLTLYWLATILQQRTSGAFTLTVYIAGGLIGALLFWGCSFVWPSEMGTALQGASASVMAVVACIATIEPNQWVSLFITWKVKLWWIAGILLVAFALGLSGSNAGGHIAHIGGLMTGIAAGFAFRWHELKERETFEPAISEAEARRQLNILLDKVRQSGYSSLSHIEKEQLIKLSRKI